MHKQILTVAVMAAIAGMSVAAVADESTTVGGKAYIDFTDINQESNGTKTTPSGLGLDVKRFYLSISHGFDDMWSANLTTDFNYAPVSCATVINGVDFTTSTTTSTSACTPTKETQLYVKKAYLQAKFSDAAVLRVGSSDMPWIPYVEDIYGYRFVENTLIDRLKFGTSADWGAHFGGKVMDGKINYALSAVNGNGYKNPSRSRSVDFAGRVGVIPVQGLNLAVDFYSGKLGNDVEGTTTANTANRWDVLAAYSYNMLKVGAEYFNAKNFTSKAITTGPSDKADGYSVWGSVSLREKLAVFARYDQAKPSKDVAPNLKDTYYNMGVSYEARKNVKLALAYKHEKVENGTISTASSGTIGGSNDGTYSEVGVWTEVKF